MEYAVAQLDWNVFLKMDSSSVILKRAVTCSREKEGGRSG
jgi:hypothetical protein